MIKGKAIGKCVWCGEYYCMDCCESTKPNEFCSDECIKENKHSEEREITHYN